MLVSADEVRARVREMDATTDWGEVEGVLRDLGWSRSLLPFLVEAYPTFRKQQARATAVYFAKTYARSPYHDEDAFALVLLGLADRAKMPKFWACQAAAHALRADALPSLRPLVRHRDAEVRGWARGAVRAINKQEPGEFIGPGRKTSWPGKTEGEGEHEALALFRQQGLIDAEGKLL